MPLIEKNRIKEGACCDTICPMSTSQEQPRHTNGQHTGQPRKAAIVRAIASSTAIETGQSIAQIERTLRAKTGKFRHLSLAN